MSNREIRESLEFLRHSDVAKAYQRFKLQMSKDNSLRGRIDWITGRLS